VTDSGALTGASELSSWWWRSNSTWSRCHVKSPRLGQMIHFNSYI